MSDLAVPAAGKAAGAVAVRAAGAVVWRPGPDGQLEVLVVHRPKYDDWSLPKGKLDRSEHPLTAAVREVSEETGHRVTLGRPLPAQRYRVSAGTKEVRYWAARADGSATAWPGTDEIDLIEFLPPEKALSRLSYDRDAALVQQLLDGPAETVPLVILRHTDAAPREDWPGSDLERPLHPNGLDLAERIVPLLRALLPTRVVASDALRCVQSVRPYASTVGAAIELEPRVSEEGFERQPSQVATVLRQLLADGAPTLLCTHRPVLRALTSALAGHVAPGVEVPDEPLPPGGFIAAHAAAGRVVAVELHEP